MQKGKDRKQTNIKCMHVHCVRERERERDIDLEILSKIRDISRLVLDRRTDMKHIVFTHTYINWLTIIKGNLKVSLFNSLQHLGA